MSSKRLENYLELLKIRQAAKRRDTIISGGVFFVMFILMIVLGMIDGSSGRSVYFAAALITGMGFGYLTTWVRHEIIKGSIELIDNLQ